MPSGVYPRTEFHRELCRRANLGKPSPKRGKRLPPEIASRMYKLPHLSGEQASHWIHGLSKNKDYKHELYRRWAKANPDKIRLNKRRHVWLKRKAGILHKSTIQSVYEDNIKLFGTLTCVYCIEKIVFGSDTIDHIVPLKRGGNHDKDNLVIACRFCNSFKKDKLYSEVI